MENISLRLCDKDDHFLKEGHAKAFTRMDDNNIYLVCPKNDESSAGWAATISHETLHMVLEYIFESVADYALDCLEFKDRMISFGMKGKCLELLVRSGITGTAYVQKKFPKFYGHFVEG